MTDANQEGRPSLLHTAGQLLSPMADLPARIREVISSLGAVEALVEQSRTALLVVLQRRDLSRLRRSYAGSTTATVAARAACPVLSVHPHHAAGDGREVGAHGVVVGVNPRHRSDAALAWAAEEATLRDCPLTAVHAWNILGSPTSYGYAPPAPDEVEGAREWARTALEEAVSDLRRRHPDLELHVRTVRARSPRPWLRRPATPSCWSWLVTARLTTGHSASAGSPVRSSTPPRARW